MTHMPESFRPFTPAAPEEQAAPNAILGCLTVLQNASRADWKLPRIAFAPTHRIHFDIKPIQHRQCKA